MLNQGSEWIKHVGKHVYDGYFALKEQATDVTSLTPNADYLHFYAKESGGATELFYKNSAGTERTLNTAAIGMSIGGTVTSGTPGSILFVGSGPVLAQDNSNLFWDNTNKRLGIGTSSPANPLHVLRTALTDGAIRISSAGAHGLSYQITNSQGSARLFVAGAATDFVNTSAAGDCGLRTATSKNLLFGIDTAEVARITSGGDLVIGHTAVPWATLAQRGFAVVRTGGSLLAEMDAYTFGVAGIVTQNRLVTARGTATIPTATQSGDGVRWSFNGYGTDFTTARAFMEAAAIENWSGSAQGAYLVFGTTPVGSTTSAERARITPHGSLLIGLSSQDATRQLGLGGTVTYNTGSHAALEIRTTFNGSAGGAGNEIFGVQVAPTFQPSGSVTETNGFRVDAQCNPGGGVTVANHRGGRFVVYSGNGAGAITVLMGLHLLPVFGGIDPGTNYGLRVENFGNAGSTTSIGISVAAQTGSTSNFVFELPSDATDPTAGGGAATGRIPCLIGGALRYIPYY